MSVHSDTAPSIAASSAIPLETLTIRFFTSSSDLHGTYFRFHNLARALVARGHRVTVHAPDRDWHSSRRTEVRDEVEYDIFPESRPVGPFAAPMQPLTAIRRAHHIPGGCDVAHLFQPFISGLGAWQSTPASLRVYDWDEMWAGGLYPPRYVLKRPGIMALSVLERAMLRASRHITVVGKWLEERARAWGAPGSVEIIHNGFTPRPLHDKAEARAELDLVPEALYLGFISRTTPQFDWLFEALKQVRARHPSIRLAIAGQMIDRVKTAPVELRDSIDYVGDLSPERAQLCAEAVDIGLLPMQDDTWNRSRFAIKFADYMAAGLNVVCSSVGECGRLAQMFDQVTPAGTTLSEWIDAVERAVERSDQLPWPRRVAATEAEAALSWSAIAARLESFYRRELTSNL